MKLNRITLMAVASLSFAASAALAQTESHRSTPSNVVPTADRPANCMDGMRSREGMGDRSMNHTGSMGMNHTDGMGMDHSMHITNELDYLSLMILHHQEAIDTAQQVLATSDRSEMQQFAQEVIEVQSAEVQQMQTWLDQWYGEPTSTLSYNPMMRELSQLEGDELDQAFLEDMVMHHQTAVMMSQMLLHHSLVEHDAVQPFAEEIVSTQRQEIHQMQTWLQEWFGVDGMGGRHQGGSHQGRVSDSL